MSVSAENGSVLSAEAIPALFRQVCELLERYRAYWQFSPMACRDLPWQADLNKPLQCLSLDELAAIDQSPELQQAQFGHFFPELAALPLFWQAHAQARVDAKPPFWLTNGIHGRKLEQIQQFCHFVPQSDLPVLEWCAGKGHLGRLLAAATGCQVTSVEWQQALCEEGQQLAEHFKLPQQFVQADVLDSNASILLQAEQQALALHACGQLHIQLITLASQLGTAELQVVPCCYHLIPDERYRPLSVLAQQSDFRLSRQDLKLAVQGQVTAGERIARLRQTEVTWRLAYDSLQQSLTGYQQYKSLPSCAKKWFSGDFKDFIQHAAALQQLQLPETLDYAALLAAGAERYLLLQRLDAIRHLFRRPLELYLVLDRALFLQQQGYQVQLFAFCDYQLTPRNLCLQASLLHLDKNTRHSAAKATSNVNTA